MKKMDGRSASSRPLKLRKQGESSWRYFPSHSAAIQKTDELRKLKHPMQRINGVLDPKKQDRAVAGFEVVSVTLEEYNQMSTNTPLPLQGTPASAFCISSASSSFELFGDDEKAKSTEGGTVAGATIPRIWSRGKFDFDFDLLEIIKKLKINIEINKHLINLKYNLSSD